MIRQLLEILRTPVCRRQYGVFQDIPSPRGARLPAEWLKEEFPELAEEELPPIVDFLAVEHGKFWKPTVALSPWWLVLSNNQSNQDQLAVTPITARELFLTCLVQRSLRRNSHPSRRVMLMLELAGLFAGFVGFALLEIHHKDDAIYYNFLLFLALFALFLPIHYAIGGWSGMGCCEDIASALRYYENMHHVKTGKGWVKLRWFLRIDR